MIIMAGRNSFLLDSCEVQGVSYAYTAVRQLPAGLCLLQNGSNMASFVLGYQLLLLSQQFSMSDIISHSTGPFAYCQITNERFSFQLPLNVLSIDTMSEFKITQ